MISFTREFLAFLLARKKYWLIPILLTMAILGGLVFVSQGSAFGPFIYSLF